jgi:4-amino-4-deoxy-L-arabinose transferase-like glycosyltransferase|tara:strand:- start:148 stop:1488 length:1341 start_codon:yes stop_codon:yes gene_type:complete
MQIKKNIDKNLITFLFVHLILWTLVPSLSNNNLPLDTIEHLAWATDLQFGYEKHPPLVAWILGLFYELFGSQDWSYYFLSQLFIIIAFYTIFRFSSVFFTKKIYCLISVMLLEGIYFYNYTTPEFNVNICQIPFWILSTFYFWKGFTNNKIKNWILFGFFSALGILSKYLFIYLLVSLGLFFIIMTMKRKINYNFLFSLFPLVLILSPHLYWLIENNFTTIAYALNRTGLGEQNILNHISQPLIFLAKQIGILIPFFIMLLMLISKVKIKYNTKDKKLLFLIAISITPILLMFLTSVFTGAKIRTMWMTPFYLFFSIFIVYIFKDQINLNKLKNFVSTFLILFFLSPLSYLIVSVTQKDKRTDYPGKKIAIKVQEIWNDKHNSKISYVVGDEWVGGNLSYHLKSRPKWMGIEGKVKSKDELSIVNVYKNNISEAISKIGYFKVYGE